MSENWMMLVGDWGEQIRNESLESGPEFDEEIINPRAWGIEHNLGLEQKVGLRCC